MELPHDPLIPACDEHNIGIEVNGSVPLFLDIVAVLIGIGRQVRKAVPPGIAAPECIPVVEMRADTLRVGVLPDADRDQFAASVRACDILVLREDLQPAPLVGALGAACIQRLSGAEGEEIPYLVEQARIRFADAGFRKSVRVCHDKRLPVQAEPQVGV